MHEFHLAGWVTFITQLNYRAKSHLSIIPDNSGLYSTLAANAESSLENRWGGECGLGVKLVTRGLLKGFRVARV